MKDIFNKLKLKAINFCKWIWHQVKDWHNLVILLVVAAAVFVLCVAVVTAVMFFADTKIHILAATAAVIAFWMGPFTPFWPLCIAITLAIRKIIDKIKQK